MAKYICDFDKVRGAANDLINAAWEVESVSTNHSQNMSNCLNSWSGSAKTNFISQNDVKTQEAVSKAKKANEIGNKINDVVKKIEEIEQELGNLSI